MQDRLLTTERPFAIAMWDFSWLERRWPGAGYEDWDLALDELGERGYNAVRIDAYPHLVSSDPEASWTLEPCWNQNDWGSPSRISVQVQPALNQFLEKCQEREISVALSSWYRRDTGGHYRFSIDPESHARNWIQTIRSIEAAGLLQTLLYVDFCNEWPLEIWAPYFNPKDDKKFGDEESLSWIDQCLAEFKSAYPEIPVTFSNIGKLGLSMAQFTRISGMDFFEPHLWMAQAEDDRFYQQVGYRYEKFETVGYENMVKFAEPLYRSNSDYWNSLQRNWIHEVAEEALDLGRFLVTTEGWSVVDYKDWPGLDWGWVKASCEHGILCAVETGRWLSMCSSNFCGPQFVGMWRDVEWHQRITSLIRNASIDRLDESVAYLKQA